MSSSFPRLELDEQVLYGDFALRWRKNDWERKRRERKGMGSKGNVIMTNGGGGKVCRNEN